MRASLIHFLTQAHSVWGDCLKLRSYFACALFSLLSVGHVLKAEVSLPDELDLEAVQKFALENNFAIRQAKERIEQQNDVIVLISSGARPKVALNYNYSIIDRNRLEDFGGSSFGSDQDWSVNLELTQRLYSGGRSFARVTEEKKRLKAAELELQAIINEQMLNVRVQFYNVLLAREKIEVRKESLRLLEEQLKTVTDRFEAGAVSKFDKLRAEVALANGRPPLIRAKNEFRIALEELRELVGFTVTRESEVSKVPEVVGELVYKEAAFELWEALNTAHANRPELQRLVLLEGASEKAVRAEKAAYYPDLEVVLGYQVRKSTFTNELNETVDGWSIGIQGTWSIFDSWATRSRVAQAKSILNQARLTTGETGLSIDVETRRAYSSWLEAEELVKASTVVIEQAKEAVRLADARYLEGSATQLDVLQAQVELTEAQTNQVEALHAYNVAVATMRKAMGAGVVYEF